MSELRPLLLKLERYGGDAGEEKLETIARALEVALLDFGRFPPELFAALARRLKDEAFLALPESWRVLRLIDSNWEMLSSEQKEELRPLVVEAFPGWGDWMGSFVGGEVLGGRYADEAALAALQQLGRHTRPDVRAMVPHGLEVLVAETEDDHLREEAIRSLDSLTRDADEEVRGEATDSHGRVLKARDRDGR